jgi:hypothetical protein
MEAVNMSDLISEEDMQKGKSTEVWYTGEDFINSGKAKDYSEYVTREIPMGAVVILAGNRFFAKSTSNRYVELEIKSETEYSYGELLEINQQAIEVLEEEMIIEENVIQSSSQEEKKEEKPKKKKSNRKKRLNVNE